MPRIPHTVSITDPQKKPYFEKNTVVFLQRIIPNCIDLDFVKIF